MEWLVAIIGAIFKAIYWTTWALAATEIALLVELIGDSI